MRLLKMGSRGDGVHSLQQQLRRFEPTLVVDGVFGTKTERATRIAQRRLGLFPPDGIAGPKTTAALAGSNAGSTKSVSAEAAASNGSSISTRVEKVAEHAAQKLRSLLPGALTGPAAIPPPIRNTVAPAMARARTAPLPPGDARPAKGMRMSLAGRRFIIRHEGLKGVSNRLHHPTMGSGVTIGPGYDMKDRTPAQVASHLRLIGVDPATAEKAAQGAGKQGSAARRFVAENKHLLDLSDDKQAALLFRIVGHYEGMVHRAITIPLHQHQFDALVSYAYNPGGGWKKTTALVNVHDYSGAMIEISRHVYSKKQKVDSLVTRRKLESRMFIYGEYR